MFGDAFEDAAKGCHWMLEYERGLSHVIVACWMYASRADEAYAAGYEHGRSIRERELHEAQECAELEHNSHAYSLARWNEDKERLAAAREEARKWQWVARRG